eukprot:6478150-Amphidinium_carterae.2
MQSKCQLHDELLCAAMSERCDTVSRASTRVIEVLHLLHSSAKPQHAVASCARILRSIGTLDGPCGKHGVKCNLHTAKNPVLWTLRCHSCDP